jgi:hypothetical protein
MKKVTFTNEEFTRFVWGPFVSGTAKSEDELEVSIRVLKKFKAASLPREITEAEKEQGVIPHRSLKKSPTHFLFEEDEHRNLLARLRDFLPKVVIAIAEEYHDVLMRVKDAEEPKTVEPRSQKSKAGK